MSLFTELDHRLSVIKRYSILHTLQTQSVAEHVFNVERICRRLCAMIPDLKASELADVLEWAHHHEDYEALHGDFPSMAKPYFETAAFERDHAGIMVPIEPANERTRVIVKLADLLEMYRFLAMETTLGNQFVVEHVTFERGKISKFLKDNPAHFSERFTNAVLDWMLYGQPTRSMRHSKRGA